MDSSDDDRRHDPAAAVELIEQVRRNPRPLEREELLELLERPIYLGRPRPARTFEQRIVDPGKRRRANGAGRPSSRTQYDLWTERRRDLHRRLIKLPRLRLSAGIADEAVIVQLAHRFQNEGIPRTGRNGLVAKIREQLQQNAVDAAIRMLARPGKIRTVPSRMTINRILERNAI